MNAEVRKAEARLWPQADQLGCLRLVCVEGSSNLPCDVRPRLVTRSVLRAVAQLFGPLMTVQRLTQQL